MHYLLRMRHMPAPAWSNQRLVAYLTVLTYWDMTESTLLPLSFTSRCKRRISRMSASVSTNTCRRKEDHSLAEAA